MARLEALAGDVAAGEKAGPTRREFLQRAGAAGALATAASLAPAARWLPAANAATAPRIVVVGGGLAGLTCAYRLKQAGYAAQLYEASDRARRALLVRSAASSPTARSPSTAAS